MPQTEYAAVATSLQISKWALEDVQFVLRKEDRDALTALKKGASIRILPETFARHKIEPYEVWQADNVNLITTAGWAALLGSIAGTSIGTKFSASAGRIGVGTSSTAASGANTYLGGDTGSASTTSYYQLVSAAPTIVTTGTGTYSDVCTLAFSATFGTGNANFAWNEFGTDNAAASGVYLNGLSGGPYVFLNHGVVSMGTKASGQTWTATETISFGYPSGSGTVG